MSEVLEVKYKYFLGLRINHDSDKYIDVNISKEEAIRIRNLINSCLESDDKEIKAS